jgi:hypothetical protein
LALVFVQTAMIDSLEQRLASGGLKDPFPNIGSLLRGGCPACVVCSQSLVGKFCLQNADVLVGLRAGVCCCGGDYGIYGNFSELAGGE